jgi:carbonic anhydrase
MFTIGPSLSHRTAFPCGCIACGRVPRSGVSRRHVLAALGGVAPAMLVARRGMGQTTLSPGDALGRLMAGNRRYVAKQMTSFTEDLDILRQNNVDKQEPFAAVLSCADSRVPVEVVFDQAIGHVFVTRVAGTICTPEVIAGLEFGAAVLGTAAILVLGHEGCGAVKAAIAGEAVPGQISALYAPLRQAVERAGPDLVAVIKANAQIQANLLGTTSPVLAGLIKQGRLKIVPGYYNLGDGSVALLD